MADVKLYKKEGTYFNKEKQKDVPYTNFYVQCGSELIAVQPCYFPNDKCEGRDPGFLGRKSVLSAFAEPLPEKDEAN